LNSTKNGQNKNLNINEGEYLWKKIFPVPGRIVWIFLHALRLISMCGTKVKFPVRQLLDTFRRSVASTQSKEMPKFRQIN
jgi:hypothetical protein